MICPNKAHEACKMNGVDLDGNWVCPKCRLVLADKPPMPALDRRGQAALAILQTLLAKHLTPPESNPPRLAAALADELLAVLSGVETVKKWTRACPRCGSVNWSENVKPSTFVGCGCGWGGQAFQLSVRTQELTPTTCAFGDLIRGDCYALCDASLTDRPGAVWMKLNEDRSICLADVPGRVTPVSLGSTCSSTQVQRVPRHV